MSDNFTVIVVGHTETDEYGNMWVTPKGGGDKVKIAKKREHLFPLFQQGQALKLDWQTYMNKPYVANAVPLEGELPPAKTPEIPKEHQGSPIAETPAKPVNPQELGLAHKLFSDAWIAGFIDEKLPDGKEMVLKHKLWMRLMILGR